MVEQILYMTNFLEAFLIVLAIHIVISLNLNNLIYLLIYRITLSLMFNLVENQLDLLLMDFLTVQRDFGLEGVILLVFIFFRINLGHLFLLLELLPLDVSSFEVLNFEFLFDCLIYTRLRHRSIVRILNISLWFESTLLIDLLLLFGVSQDDVSLLFAVPLPTPILNQLPLNIIATLIPINLRLEDAFLHFLLFTFF